MVKPLHATPRQEPADAFVIAVPMPFNAVDRSPNLDHVDPAADGISRDPRFGKCVDFVGGATERLAGRLTRRRPDLSFPPTRHDEPLDVHVAHCWERVLPVCLVRELIENDRIIGGMTETCAADHAPAVYRVFLQGVSFRTDAPTVELVKLAANASGDGLNSNARKVSPFWHRGDDKPRIDGDRVPADASARLQYTHSRMAVSEFDDLPALRPSWSQISDKASTSSLPTIVAQVRERTERSKRMVCSCLGLTYKPDVDDLRQRSTS
jgi:UDP-N-acetyl-D-mannosaminuronic acid dehydrogenase